MSSAMQRKERDCDNPFCICSKAKEGKKRKGRSVSVSLEAIGEISEAKSTSSSELELHAAAAASHAFALRLQSHFCRKRRERKEAVKNEQHGRRSCKRAKVKGPRNRSQSFPNSVRKSKIKTGGTAERGKWEKKSQMARESRAKKSSHESS